MKGCSQNLFMKQTKRRLFLVLNVLLVFAACKKDNQEVGLDPLKNPPKLVNYVDSDFVFFSKKNAKWIISSYLRAQINPTTIATADFIDTFYIGVDTLMDVWIYNPDSARNVKRPITYTELKASGYITYSGSNNTEFFKQRYGWFRQDVSKRRIYGPVISPGNVVDDRLLMDFNLKVGEKLPFGYTGSGYPSVTLIDSVKFGKKYLRRLETNPTALRTPDIVEGRDFFAVVNPRLHLATAWVWSKFIYKQDTLTTYY